VVQKGKSDLNADRIAEKSPVHKCQNLAVLDRTFDSIYQGPVVAPLLARVANHSHLATGD
jgi:hypothetical protein